METLAKSQVTTIDHPAYCSVISSDGYRINATPQQQRVSTAYAMATMSVVANAGHVIELADGTHYGTRVVLLHRLSSGSHQRLD